MRTWAYLAIVGALTGCSSKSIDAGTNDAAVVEADGATLLATGIVPPPVRFVSDGTTLYWTDLDANVSSMPASGGEPRVILTKVFETFLSVDDENIYVGSAAGLYRFPKIGGSPTLIIDQGPNPPSHPPSQAIFATVLGANAYWLDDSETTPYGASSWPEVVKTVPLKGGATSLFAQFEAPTGGDGGSPAWESPEIAVTSSTAFLGTLAQTPLGTDGYALTRFPTGTGMSDGGTPQSIPGVTQECLNLISDTDAVYCYVLNGPIIRIASSGASSLIGSALAVEQPGPNPSLLAVDDANVYWIGAGQIERASKASPGVGGRQGSDEVVMDSKTPVALAVDGAYVYWANAAGEIKRLSTGPTPPARSSDCRSDSLAS